MGAIQCLGLHQECDFAQYMSLRPIYHCLFDMTHTRLRKVSPVHDCTSQQKSSVDIARCTEVNLRWHSHLQQRYYTPLCISTLRLRCKCYINVKISPSSCTVYTVSPFFFFFFIVVFVWERDRCLGLPGEKCQQLLCFSHHIRWF